MKKISTLFIFVLFFGGAVAQPFVQWDFENVYNPSFGSGTFSLVNISFNTTSFNAQFPNGEAGSAFNVIRFPAANDSSGLAGVEFAVSTEGRSGIIISMNMRHSNSSSRFVRFLYSSDGTNFNTIDLTPENSSTRLLLGGSNNQANSTIDYANDAFAALVGDTWHRRIVDLTSIAAVNNNPNFKFRVVTIFEPGTNAYRASSDDRSYATSGTLRFDSVRLGSNSTLPIRLSTFSGRLSNQAVKLNWSTSDESDGRHFEVEKSTNGSSFSKLGVVALGSSSATYEFTDNKPVAGYNWYRLKMQHRDGTAYYSAVVKVAYNREGLIVSPIYPTLVQSRLLVKLQADRSRQVEATIFNQSGQQVARKSLTANAGEGSFEIGVGNLQAGQYRVLFQSNGVTVSNQVFIKQ
ncbi:MAG: hypothetical protein MUF24_08495 [Chitinophagaceae bacterium]|jgi:hypothetical protein|nr:hypothetical protein [Chitinophagaceae bacterium]